MTTDKQPAPALTLNLATATAADYARELRVWLDDEPSSARKLAAEAFGLAARADATFAPAVEAATAALNSPEGAPLVARLSEAELEAFDAKFEAEATAETFQAAEAAAADLRAFLARAVEASRLAAAASPATATEAAPAVAAAEAGERFAAALEAVEFEPEPAPEAAPAVPVSRAVALSPTLAASQPNRSAAELAPAPGSVADWAHARVRWQTQGEQAAAGFQAATEAAAVARLRVAVVELNARRSLAPSFLRFGREQAAAAQAATADGCAKLRAGDRAAVEACEERANAAAAFAVWAAACALAPFAACGAKPAELLACAASESANAEAGDRGAALYALQELANHVRPQLARAVSGSRAYGMSEQAEAFEAANATWGQFAAALDAVEESAGLAAAASEAARQVESVAVAVAAAFAESREPLADRLQKAADAARNAAAELAGCSPDGASLEELLARFLASTVATPRAAASRD